MKLRKTICGHKLGEDIRHKVLSFVMQMQTDTCQFRMSAKSDSTIFTSCFALFILDVFGQTKKFTDEERQVWVSYIQSFQHGREGYFEPEEYFHSDIERNRYQLTCFCLSALRILNAKPIHQLCFLKQWQTPRNVEDYLIENGCHLGKGGSGNKAMFLAVFLTREYEKTKSPDLLEKIDAWFDFHDRTQNKSGFWGSGRKSHFFHGMQNGFHQMLIYFYWQRKINKLEKIVDIALSLQDCRGFFSPVPGGWPCYDYDAIHILINACKLIDYRHRDIKESLEKVFNAISNNINDDGGFCQSRQKPCDFFDLIRNSGIILSGTNPFIWYYRLRRSTAVVVRRQADTIKTGWTREGRKWEESNLWDTWFRCLSLAEIANTVQLENDYHLKEAVFHKMIGLGFGRFGQVDQV